jgi:lysozyme
MNLDLLRAEIENEEGFEPHAYLDSNGWWTIGIGRLIDRRKGGGITHDEAKYLFENDVRRVVAEIDEKLPWLKEHPDVVQRAIANMVFQMGIEGVLKFVTTLSLIQQRKYTHAANNALKSKWAKQTPARAARVTDLIRNAKP